MRLTRLLDDRRLAPSMLLGLMMSVVAAPALARTSAPPVPTASPPPATSSQPTDGTVTACDTPFCPSPSPAGPGDPCPSPAHTASPAPTRPLGSPPASLAPGGGPVPSTAPDPCAGASPTPSTAVVIDPDACLVRNLTTGTSSDDLAVMVAAAQDGAQMTVTGRCAGDEVVISADLTITGDPAGAVLSGSDEHRVMSVKKGATVEVSGVVIQDGYEDSGGGITNAGTLTVSHSVVRGNHADGQGGGISNEGTLVLRHSLVQRNKGWGIGGGIRNTGTLTLWRSEILGNNTSDAGGGGISNQGTLVLRHSLVRRNRAGGLGGGIDSWGGTVTLDGRSRVIRNTPDDCTGTTAC